MVADRRAPAWFEWITVGARLILGGVLVWAGMMKILDIGQSVIAVRAYDFPIPEALVSLIGYGMPIVEILLGLALVAGILTRWAGLAAAVMMVMYIAAIASAWARGLSIDCGCLTPGGVILDPSQETKYGQDILRDVGLIICAVWLVVFPRARVSVDTWLGLGGRPEESGGPPEESEG
ncbi:MAG: DoxX family protein [Propionibacteriaceae bacterium]|jgi:uncharacterized membrane protein YphA (DoxX/SURF4 family)|nr:DoxX family protein [Propionibacteriaceae bacterium]